MVNLLDEVDRKPLFSCEVSVVSNISLTFSVGDCFQTGLRILSLRLAVPRQQHAPLGSKVELNCVACILLYIIFCLKHRAVVWQHSTADRCCIWSSDLKHLIQVWSRLQM